MSISKVDLFRKTKAVIVELREDLQAWVDRCPKMYLGTIYRRKMAQIEALEEVLIDTLSYVDEIPEPSTVEQWREEYITKSADAQYAKCAYLTLVGKLTDTDIDRYNQVNNHALKVVDNKLNEMCKIAFKRDYLKKERVRQRALNSDDVEFKRRYELFYNEKLI